MSHLVHESPEHAGAVEDLLDEAFGPGRFAKTTYRLREGVEPVRELSWLWVRDGQIQGTLRYWPIRIAYRWDGLMLGPLAVLPSLRGTGIGRALMRHTLDLARDLGHERVMLVGDEPYYARVGFSREMGRGLTLPGPVDPERVLGLELVRGAMKGVTGLVGKPPALHRAAIEGGEGHSRGS